MAPMFDTRLPSIEALETAPCYFRYGNSKRRILVDKLTADAILACYRVVKPENQEKFARMVSGSPTQLHKIAGFCFSRVKLS